MPSAVSKRRAGAGTPFVWSLMLHAGVAASLVVGAWILREKTATDLPFIVERWAPADPTGAPARDPRTDAGHGDGAASSAPDFIPAMERRQRVEEQRAEREIARMREQRRHEEEREAGLRQTAVGATRSEDRERDERPRTSYERFQSRRSHGPAKSAETAAQDGGSGARLRIDAGEVLRAGGPETGATGPGPGSAAGGATIAGYFGELLGRLRAAHEKPDGLDDRLSAEVEFRLAADGSITRVRIIRSSGDAAFDRSVLDVFARVRMPARPDGESDVRRLTFRVRQG